MLNERDMNTLRRQADRMHLALTWMELEGYRTSNFQLCHNQTTGGLRGRRTQGCAFAPGRIAGLLAGNALRAANPSAKTGYSFADVHNARRLVEAAACAMSPQVWA